MKFVQTYLHSGALILATTSAAKFYSAFGTAKILSQSDPLFHLSNRVVLVLVALIELFVAGVLLSRQRDLFKFLALAWLSVNFMAYRFALSFFGLGGHCPCLGNITDKLGIQPSTADLALQVVLLYFFAGSLAFLLATWVKHKAARSATESPTTSPTGVVTE